MAPAGVRAEVTVDRPDRCPIAAASREAGASCRTVSRCVGPLDTETVTEEFVLDSDVELDRADVEHIFSYGGSHVYRFERRRGVGCPCEAIERHGCPVVDVTAHDGTLRLAFHTPDIPHLQAIVGDFRTAFDGFEIRRLLRSSEDRSEEDLVFVDRGTLTDRQREVLDTAHEMGYFDHPKGANAGEVADALGITTSTFTEHLSAAQSKLFATILVD